MAPDSNTTPDSPRIALDPASARALEAPENESLREFYSYWDGKRQDDTSIPTRKSIDPVEIPRLLKHIFLTDVVHEGDQVRFRYRLIGTGIVEKSEKNHTGRYIDELNPDPDSAMRRQYDDVYYRRPLYLREDTAYWYERDFVSYRCLLLPLSEDGRNVTHMVGLLAFDKA